MYSRLIVPLDGSELAEQVLPYARSLAKTLAISVELLEVVDPDALTVLVNPEQGRFLDSLLADRREKSRVYLERIGQSFSGTQVRCSVENGKAEHVIIDKAAADNSSLILMATHGRSGIRRWLLGSVADKVLHGATNHLFLVRATDKGVTDGEAPLKKVIVPLDGSPLAEKVLPHVSELAQKMRLEVLLLRAYALPPAMSANEYGTYSEELINQLEAEAKDYLKQTADNLEKTRVKGISSITQIGFGAEEIASVARATPDNFIAMCTHGRSGVTRWALGSVTERVVRHSGDPVLIIRAGSER